MVSFIDVKSGYWAYDDIMEAANTFLEDGQPLIGTIPFQAFEKDKGYIYEEIKATKNQVKFTLGKLITPTNDNPLFVYVDGVQYGYKSTAIENGKTVVYLYTPVAQGSVVSFMSVGVPALKQGRPYTVTKSYYPHYKLKHADSYTFHPANGFNEYLVVFGKQLKRVLISQEDIDATTDAEHDQELARKLIGTKTDVYLMSPSGRIHLPWNFEGMTGKITYAYVEGGVTKKTTEEFQAWTTSKTDTAREPYHNDRFFPGVWVKRAEYVVVLDRLRKYFYQKFTDYDAPGSVLDFVETAYLGQSVFRLNGTYPSGKGLLEVYKQNPESEDWELLTKDTHYSEFDDHTVVLKPPADKGEVFKFYYEKKQSDHLFDVGRDVRYWDKTNGKFVNINGTTQWWVEHVLSLDSEIRNDGERLIAGKSITNFFDPTNKEIPIVDDYYRPTGSGPGRSFFMPHTPISRTEAMLFTNRFRKWCLERFL